MAAFLHLRTNSSKTRCLAQLNVQITSTNGLTKTSATHLNPSDRPQCRSEKKRLHTDATHVEFLKWKQSCRSAYVGVHVENGCRIHTQRFPRTPSKSCKTITSTTQATPGNGSKKCPPRFQKALPTSDRHPSEPKTQNLCFWLTTWMSVACR